MNWIPVTEHLPEVGQEVLMWVAAEVRGESDDGREIGQDVSQVAMGNCMTGPCGPYLSCYVSPFADFEHITHWMPLPQPPGAQASSLPPEVVVLLRIWQSRLGASRDQCDEPGRKLWGRIDAALGVAGTPAPSNTRVLDVGFKFEGGAEYTPTVLVGFALNDWEARDAFVRALTSGVKGPDHG